MAKKSKDKTLCEGKHIRLLQRGTYEFASRRKHSGIVAIVAANGDGKMILIEQFRPPVNKRVIEIPAGLAGDVEGHEAVALATAAKRELLEETGYEAKTMKPVGEGPPSAGICDEVITMFVASGLKKTGDGAGDGSEDITLHEIPLSRVPGFLKRKQLEGCLIDLKVYGALYFLQK
jgi:ADP-ribose pyrophosphatase